MKIGILGCLEETLVLNWEWEHANLERKLSCLKKILFGQKESLNGVLGQRLCLHYITLVLFGIVEVLIVVLIRQTRQRSYKMKNMFPLLLDGNMLYYFKQI